MHDFGHCKSYKVNIGLHIEMIQLGVATTCVSSTWTGTTLELDLLSSDLADSGPRSGKDLAYAAVATGLRDSGNGCAAEGKTEVKAWQIQGARRPASLLLASDCPRPMVWICTGARQKQEPETEITQNRRGHSTGPVRA
jgi:hypothetical protein